MFYLYFCLFFYQWEIYQMIEIYNIMEFYVIWFNALYEQWLWCIIGGLGTISLITGQLFIKQKFTLWLSMSLEYKIWKQMFSLRP